MKSLVSKKRGETLKFLEENTGKKFHDIGLGNDFMNITSKAQATKVKIEKLDHIKTETFSVIKGLNQQSEKAAFRIEDNICNSYI